VRLYVRLLFFKYIFRSNMMSKMKLTGLDITVLYQFGSGDQYI